MARIVKKKRGIFERPKGSGVWWICYFDQFGTKHWEKVGLRSAAVNQYQRRKVEVTQKKFDPDEIEGKHRNATVGQIVEDYLKASESAGRRAMKDIRIRALYWKGLWPDKSARSIMPSDIENARLELARSKLKSNKRKTDPSGGRSVATVNRYLARVEGGFLVGTEEWQGGAEPS